MKTTILIPADRHLTDAVYRFMKLGQPSVPTLKSEAFHTFVKECEEAVFAPNATYYNHEMYINENGAKDLANKCVARLTAKNRLLGFTTPRGEPFEMIAHSDNVLRRPTRSNTSRPIHQKPIMPTPPRSLPDAVYTAEGAIDYSQTLVVHGFTPVEPIRIAALMRSFETR